MFHCSAAEGQRFQEEIIRISNIIANLGRNPLEENDASNKDNKRSNSNEKIKTDQYESWE